MRHHYKAKDMTAQCTMCLKPCGDYYYILDPQYQSDPDYLHYIWEFCSMTCLADWSGNYAKQEKRLAG